MIITDEDKPMKSETFNLINHEVKKALISRIISLDVDGKLKVTISNIGSKSSRQQGLDWKWDGEIFSSGIGWVDDTVEKTHARGKWMFARPILLRDDALFQGIYNYFMTIHSKDEKKSLEFAMDYISTQKMSVSQVSEYMTNKQLFWTEKGVNLTDPSLYGMNFK